LGFLYQNGTVTLLGFPIPNQKASTAAAINNSGLIVGSAVFQTGRHAATYSGGQWHDLGTIGPAGSGSEATSVNNQGWIVGTFEYAGNALNGGFLYKDGKMTNLNLPNASPDGPQVENINDQGQIVATAPAIKGNGFGVAGYLYENGQWTQIDTLLDPAQKWSIVQTYGISNTGSIVAQGIQLNSQNIEVYNGTVLLEALD
jgi:probable HAF family extracellular repeat protein